MALLAIKNLHVSIEEKEILKGINLEVAQGQLHVLMGPNGSGKSTLAAALLGKPGVHVNKGTVTLDGIDILALKPEDRYKAGLFLAFQNPREIPGVSVFSVVRMALQGLSGKSSSVIPIRQPAERNPLKPVEGIPLPPRRDRDDVSVTELFDRLKNACDVVGLPQAMIQRSLNDGFSGGEKKRVEILQMLLLHPKIAILDEIDSGLDADGVIAVAEAIIQLRKKEDIGILLITHTARMVHMLKPDIVSVMMEGKIVRQGGIEIVEDIEKNGYENS